MINRIFSAVDALYLFLISSFSVTIKSIFTILLSLLMVSYLSIEIVLFMVLLIPLNYFGFKYINKKLKVRMENMQKNAAVANKNLISTLSNQDAVKAGISAEILENLLY
ncbi:TPA: ABC transporter transmembrane domain-containing protein, partial [Enterococcus faecalis]